MSNSSLTTRLDADLKSDLEQIARFDKRSTSYMANLAIRNLVEERKATRELIQTGLALVEGGAGSLSSESVHEWFLADDEQPFPQAE
jgi:predicted transcriptional regulator